MKNTLIRRQNETDVRLKVMNDLGSRPDVRVFRNNVGSGFQGRCLDEFQGTITLTASRRINFGLFVGSGDLISWRSETITTEMVGQKIARFISVETKSGNNKPSEAQIKWARQVNAAGGIAVFVNENNIDNTGI